MVIVAAGDPGGGAPCCGCACCAIAGVHKADVRISAAKVLRIFIAKSSVIHGRTQSEEPFRAARVDTDQPFQRSYSGMLIGSTRSTRRAIGLRSTQGESAAEYRNSLPKTGPKRAGGRFAVRPKRQIICDRSSKHGRPLFKEAGTHSYALLQRRRAMTQRCEIVQDLRGGTPGLESQSAFDRLLRQYFAIPPVRDFRAKVGESEEPGAESFLTRCLTITSWSKRWHSAPAQPAQLQEVQAHSVDVTGEIIRSFR